jgi:alkylation response protein AidB-like acyl-CoA dehydrogenase
LLEQAALRADLCGVSNQFGDELRMLQADLEAALTDLGTAPRLSSSAIRHRANSLALRITQAALAVCKGAGYARGHAAELAAREAMFFLVWSCPQPVVQGVLEELSCRDPGLL